MKTKAMINVLNLYAGIGGNRKLWANCKVTAVENNPELAAIYAHHFPDDEVIVTDAHEYLLKNYKRFQYIWSSYPCQTHSNIRAMGMKIESGRGKAEPKYPDLGLYEEIIFLKEVADFYGIKYTVENVIPYYTPLIPAQKIGNHLFWANFIIPLPKEISERNHEYGRIKDLETIKGFDLDGFVLKSITKQQVLRNCFLPELGKHIFDAAFDFGYRKEKQPLFDIC